MAINYSKINHDALTKYENYSKIGAQSKEILDQMKENKESIKKAHLIAWDAGGNDLLAARKAFSDSEQDETYCRQCFMDNELGNPFATQADPRCKGIVGALQKFKQAHKKTLQFIQKNARADANIRAMGLYYPQMTQNKLTELNCKDPDTGQTYQNLYEVFLPIVAKGIYAALEPVSSARAAGDKRFNAFQALPQFNSKTSEAAQFFNYIPGDSMSYFVKDKILNHQHLLIDPYFESSWVQESQDSSAQLLQTRFLTLNESDIHPSEAGHRLLEKINSEIAYDFAPAPLKITDDLITEEWDCD
jgi:lysophospholipase L1-like esterase